MSSRFAIPLKGDEKLSSLDAIRGVAILLVVAAHYMPPISYANALSIACGNAGVILFFFLSGFLMDRNLARDGDLISYAARRAFRILPMYWMSVVIVAALTDKWTIGQVAANATFTATLFHADRMLGVYWTLYIEVLFYCVAPFLAALGARVIHLSSYIALTICIAITFAHGTKSGAPYYLIFCLLGMQVGAWHRGVLKSTHLAVSVCAVAIAVSAFVPISIYFGLVPIACALFLIGGLKFRPACRPLAFFGLISYSWYLLHTIFFHPILSLPIPHWLGLPAAACITSALSALTYAYVERPAIIFGKQLIGSLRFRAARKARTTPAEVPYSARE